MQQGIFDKAIEQCKLALSQNPNDADAYFYMGQAYGESANYKEMNEAFNQCLKIGTKYASQIEEYKNKYFTTLFNNGVSDIKQGNFEKAVQNYTLCTEILPKRMDGYINLGYAYTQWKKDTIAVEVYKKALGVDSTNLEIRSYLGTLYYRTKQYEKSVAVLKSVIDKADPKTKIYQDALYYTAYSYDLLQQTDKAIDTYMTALKATPDNKDLLFNLGRLYLLKEDYEKASEYFNRVLATNPDDFDAVFNIGFAMIQQKKYEEAVALFKKATELKPENVNAWTNYGVALIQTGKTDEGREALKKAENLKSGK
jgi:tetratricopeptide (TPR) repeat protein